MSLPNHCAPTELWNLESLVPYKHFRDVDKLFALQVAEPQGQAFLTER